MRRPRYRRRDREAVVSRLDRLLWVMESVATGGWSKSAIARRAPGFHSGVGGDTVVVHWFDDVTQRVDELVERYLVKLDDREERVVGTSSEIQNALRRRDARDQCPACGCSTRSAGGF